MGLEVVKRLRVLDIAGFVEAAEVKVAGPVTKAGFVETEEPEALEPNVPEDVAVAS